jgi:hypothetical protein
MLQTGDLVKESPVAVSLEKWRSGGESRPHPSQLSDTKGSDLFNIGALLL